MSRKVDQYSVCHSEFVIIWYALNVTNLSAGTVKFLFHYNIPIVQ